MTLAKIKAKQGIGEDHHDSFKGKKERYKIGPSQREAEVVMRF